MESSEGIVGTVKSWLKRRQPHVILDPEPSPSISGWDYETFREYLLALSRSREFLSPIEEYPSRIDLSEPWHEVFNQIRVNDFEGWALVGYEIGQRRLVLPIVAEKGLSHRVPNAVRVAGLEKARVKAHISDLVADIHSHPRSATDSSWFIPTVLTSEGVGAFSLADLYGLLNDLSKNKNRPSDPKRSLMFVAEGNENIAAFGTRRSLEIIRRDFPDSYKQFAEKWYGKYGWKFIGSNPSSQGGGELAEQVRVDASKLWQINKGVANTYQLALYRGFKDRPLLRDYPARNNI